jgi:DNA replication protein DnaC
MQLSHQLVPKLKNLRLSGILATLDVRTQQAITEKLSYVDFLERLVEDEVERRGQKQLQLRLRRATVDLGKTLEGFDFSFNPSINRQQIFDLATGHFIERHETVLIQGPAGVGKSHLAQALGHEACRRGFDVVFVSAARMLGHLHGGRADGTYERRLLTYTRPDLLILDDFGLKPLPPAGPEDFYEVIKRAVRAWRAHRHVQPRLHRMARAFSKSIARVGDAGPARASRAPDRHHRRQLPRQWAPPRRAPRVNRPMDPAGAMGHATDRRVPQRLGKPHSPRFPTGSTGPTR